MPFRNLENVADSLLVARSLDGDTQAFEALLRRYASLMTGYARKLTSSAEDAEDAVQEAFITAWHTLDTLEKPESVKPWLMRIVGRKAIDRVRSRRPDEPITEANSPPATGIQPEDSAVVRSQVQAVAGVLDALPQSQRQAWLLREVGGYSYQDVAAELNLPVSTVRGAIARARGALLRGMGEWV